MGILFTDYDGTIHSHPNGIAESDLERLKELRASGIPVAVVTGRSLYSIYRSPGFLKAEERGELLPFDYIVFSTGTGIITYPEQQLLDSRSLEADDIRSLGEWLKQDGHDFMIHQPVPANHEFLYHSHQKGGADFIRRMARYSTVSRPLKDYPSAASQFLVVLDHDEQDIADFFSRIKAGFPYLKIVKTTSPLDGRSIWCEVFTRSAGKAKGAARIAERHDAAMKDCMAFGNDYNDLDMLEAAGTSCVVAGAPEELRNRFAVVGPCGQGALDEALARWNYWRAIQSQRKNAISP